MPEEADSTGIVSDRLDYTTSDGVLYSSFLFYDFSEAPTAFSSYIWAAE